MPTTFRFGWRLIAVVLVLAASSAFGWQALWQTQLGGGEDSDAAAVAITSDGHVIAAGSVSTFGSGRFGIAKLDGSTGAPLWQYLDAEGGVFNLVLVNGAVAVVGDVYEEVFPGFSQRAGLAVTVSESTGTLLSRVSERIWERSGNIIWAGDAAPSPGGGGSVDVVTAGQVDSNDATPSQRFYVDLRRGFMTWQTWIAPFELPPYKGPGSARDVRVHPSGDVIAVGEAQELTYDQFGRLTTNGRHLLVARLGRETGAVVWTKVLTEISSAYRVTFDGAGNVIAVGVIEEAGSTGAPDFRPKDVLVLKLAAADGSEIWRSTFGTAAGGPRDSATAVVVDAAGNVVVGGQLHTLVNDPYWDNLFGTGTRELVVAKLDGTDGHELWRRIIPNTVASVTTFPLPSGVQGDVRSLALDADGSIVAAGMIDADPWGSGVTAHYATFAVTRLDGATGEVQWLQLPLQGAARSVAIASDQSVVVGGRTYVDDPDGDEDRNDLVVLKFSDRLSGAAMQLADSPSPSGRRMNVSSKDRLIHLPRAGTPSDPSVGGARLIVTDATTAEQITYDLPASGWRATAKTYKFTDPLGTLGPCSKVQLTQGKQIKVKCRGAAVDARAARGGGARVAVRLELGPPKSVYYCLEFGGTVLADVPGTFKAKGAPAPATCTGS